MCIYVYGLCSINLLWAYVYKCHILCVVLIIVPAYNVMSLTNIQTYWTVQSGTKCHFDWPLSYRQSLGSVSAPAYSLLQIRFKELLYILEQGFIKIYVLYGSTVHKNRTTLWMLSLHLLEHNKQTNTCDKALFMWSLETWKAHAGLLKPGKELWNFG